MFSTYHHANVILATILCFFHSLVNHQVHKWIKPTQDTNNVSATIELYCLKNYKYKNRET